MSLLGKRYTPEQRAAIQHAVETAEPVRVDRNAAFKCPACGHTEKQPKTVKTVMHRCPVSKTLKEMNRG